jgi:hypothetical protein
MKNILKLGILLFVMFGSFQGFAQVGQINYRYAENGKLSSLNHIFRFGKSTTYDVDFKEYSDYIDMNFKVSITLNENGTGRMVMAFEDSEKIVAVIESAYKKKYSDTNEEYWVFQCIVENSFSKDYIIDFKDGSVDSFWFKADNNTRTYFVK